MWLAVAELAADADDEHRTLLTHDGIFALFGRERGVKLTQHFGMNKGDFGRQLRLELRKSLAHQIFGALHGGIDGADHLFEELDGAIFGTNHALPVPLIDVEGMDVAQLLVGADGVHVSVDAVAGLHVILGKGQALPLGQRVHHFGACVAEVFDREIHSAFFTAEVVIDAQTAQHKQRGGDATEAQCRGKIVGKKLFDNFNALLRGVHVEQRAIVVKGNEIAHEKVGNRARCEPPPADK